MTTETASPDAIRHRYDRELTEREIALETLSTDIGKAKSTEADARAAAIVGEGTEADATRAADATRKLEASRETLQLEIKGLTKRRDDAIRAAEDAERTRKFEQVVAPAAAEYTDRLREIEAAARTLGAAFKGALEAYHRAHCGMPPPADPRYAGQTLDENFRSFADVSPELAGHVWALICDASGEKLSYKTPLPTWILGTTGAAYLTAIENGPSMVSRFGYYWPAVLERNAGRPDLAAQLRAKIDKPEKSGASKKKAAA